MRLDQTGHQLFDGTRICWNSGQNGYLSRFLNFRSPRDTELHYPAWFEVRAAGCEASAQRIGYMCWQFPALSTAGQKLLCSSSKDGVGAKTSLLSTRQNVEMPITSTYFCVICGTKWVDDGEKLGWKLIHSPVELQNHGNCIRHITPATN